VQVARQMGHAKIETTKNIYGHLFAQGQAAILDPVNGTASRCTLTKKPVTAVMRRSRDPPGPTGCRAAE
jgi:hypothetical protein